MSSRLLLGDTFAGDCEKPVEIRYRGAPDAVRVKLMLEKDQPAIVNFDARCRKCDACLRHRARLWAARGIAECALAQRTWFGTLTVRPDDRVRLLYSADLRVQRQRCEPWSMLNSTEQYKELVKEIGPELGKFLKRVRKNSGARMRYLLVSEAHKDGFPHFHMLIHEAAGSIRKRILDDAWKLGFSQFRLVGMGDTRAVWYACKYLTKSALTRVKASQRYGDASEYADAYAERLEGALEVCANAKRGEFPV